MPREDAELGAADRARDRPFGRTPPPKKVEGVKTFGDLIDLYLRDMKEVGKSVGGECTRFHAVWLSDNALDPATRSPKTGQRPITLSDISRDAALLAAVLTPDFFPPFGLPLGNDVVPASCP
jgi:hypothetical protein